MAAQRIELQSPAQLRPYPRNARPYEEAGPSNRLVVPGASAYYLGGGAIYTPRARHRLLDLKREDVRGLKSASEPYATLLAETVRQRFGATWGISETGASGPTGNPYGDAAGHCCYAVAGATTVAKTLETRSSDRLENMIAFTASVLALLEQQIAAR